MIIKTFDNIASSFTIDSDDNFVIGSATLGYNSFSSIHVGSRITYLARNVGDGFLEFESGIGDIVNNSGNITIQRDIIISSSNNNSKVQFSTAGTKNIYTNIAETSVKTGFNNLLEKTSDFIADDYQTTYIINLSNNNITATLPVATESNSGLTIRFKTVNASGNILTVSPSGSQTIDDSLNSDTYIVNTFTQYVSTGTGWQSLQQDLTLEVGSPRGETYSFQYNAGGGAFGANDISTNSDGDLNIGNSTVFRVDGNTEINKNYSNYSTIIYGNAENKNLVVSNNGNVGINIPTGYSPQTPLHIIQGVGNESIRVENRQNSNPSVFTMFHRPSIAPEAGDVNAVINLSGKDSISSQTNYTVLKSIIENSTNGVTTGSFAIGVQSNGTEEGVLSLSKLKSSIGHSNTINGNSTVFGTNNTINGDNCVVLGNGATVTDNDVTTIAKDNHSVVVGENIKILYNNVQKFAVDNDGASVTGSVTADSFKFSENVTDGSLLYTNGNSLTTSSININNLFAGNNGGLLVKTSDGQSEASPNIYTDDSGLIINDNVVLPRLNNSSPLYMNNNVVSEYTDVVYNLTNVEFNTNAVFTNGITVDPDTTASNYAVLTHSGNGVATWQNINLVDVVIDNADIKWIKYNARNVNVSDTRLQITLNDTYSTEEFSIGDTIAIVDQDTIYYRTLTNIETFGGVVFTLSLRLDGSFTSANVYSVNKGGYLDIGLNNSDPNNSSTKNTLSSRAGVDTLFNSKKADINYAINGIATNYAMYIKSNSDSTIDQSPVMFNTDTPQTMNNGDEATVTVNGSIHASSVQSDLVYLDAGIIQFNG